MVKNTVKDRLIMINRNKIIMELKTELEKLPYVNAYWLEGADGNNNVDEYSDIDIWVDFNDEFESEMFADAESILSSISPLDYKSVMDHPHPKIRQAVYHLEGTSEYLMIDFCFQLHSRIKTENTQFIKGDFIEAPNVLFDKAGIITFKDYDESQYSEANNVLLDECKYRYAQHSRVRKYIYRNQYLEAYAYYHRYVFEPLVSLLRIIYTPAHTEYYLVHISHHIPEFEREKLEYFAKISSLDDITEKITKSGEWFAELVLCIDK